MNRKSLFKLSLHDACVQRNSRKMLAYHEERAERDAERRAVAELALRLATVDELIAEGRSRSEEKAGRNRPE